TWALLDFLPKPEPSTDFTARTLSRVGVVRPVPSAWGLAAPQAPRRRWVGWAGAAAAVAAALVVGFAVGRRPAAPPPDLESDPLHRPGRRRRRPRPDRPLEERPRTPRPAAAEPRRLPRPVARTPGADPPARPCPARRGPVHAGAALERARALRPLAQPPARRR